jgi:hypothetical protein
MEVVPRLTALSWLVFGRSPSVRRWIYPSRSLACVSAGHQSSLRREHGTETITAPARTRLVLAASGDERAMPARKPDPGGSR